MTPDELIAFYTAAGWIGAAVFAAVLAGMPSGLPGRTGWWTVASALLAALAFTAEGEVWRSGARLLATLAWWEAARQWHNPGANRRVSRLWLLVPLELLAIFFAATLALPGEEGSGWIWPVVWLLMACPAAFGSLALYWWWRRAKSGPLRAAGAGLALAVMLPASGDWAAVSGFCLAWLTVAGLGGPAFRHAVVRTRPAVLCLAGFCLGIIAVPPGAVFARERADRMLRERWTDQARGNATRLRGQDLASLGSDAAAGRRVWRAVDDLRAADSSLRAARVCRFDPAGRIEQLEADGRFAPAGLATSAEQAGAGRSEAFVTLSEPGPYAGAVRVHAPLQTTRFESPVAWLVLEFPAALRDGQREAAHRTGVAGLALAGAMGAAGFVLVVRQAREAEQRAELERAQATDRAKTEFLAFLGHELRTPLQVILGRAEQLAREDGAAGRLRAVGAITTQGRLMLRLVNDLLDLGTLEAGRLVLAKEPLALRGLIAMAEENTRAAASTKGLACTVHVAPEVGGTVLADEARLLQVLGNLLGNAVKYTATGGVELRVETPRPGWVRFRVRDTGIGLPPDRIGRLFTLFTRLDSGMSFTREGTGVGLALVKRLVDLMGGTISAANRTDGPGAEFAVDLPLAAPVEAGAMPAAAPRESVAAGLRVLVAEDHPAVAELLADQLQGLGHRPVVVSDGPAALAAAGDGGFAAVLIDINLPGLDGIALARRLSALTPRPRLIGCSAEVLPETQAAARAAGMDEFLAKPAGREDLRRALAAVASPGRDLFAALQNTTAGTCAREIALAGLARTREALAEARARGDLAEVRRLAHYLRNTALVLGDPVLAAEARRVEFTPVETGGRDSPSSPGNQM